ncbi:MAG TPA: ABC-F family ATP-binding cassette domain-containing protein [Vicinamibacteria bacterium]|nr:ABC-F family ATP-binding cassette domain-containing protein [Vicinamibacteria bacterium]
MIHVEGLTKSYGDRILLEDVSWHVKKRDRIGLSGPNGSGKTTLLRMLAGFEEPDAGRIRMASDTTIGYLPQDGIVHQGKTVHEEVVMAFAPLLALKEEQHRIEDQLAQEGDTADHERLLTRYAEVTERFKDRGGYEIEASVADVLKGLGFSLEDQQRRCEEFSGGWQMRIALAKVLLARPNLVLMDEPTNHLDLPARNWLEEYLADYPGSVVLVSHDRYFLDATVKRITEVGLRTLTDYHGNYSKYVIDHGAAMERLRESHRRQSEEIEKAEAFISRFRYQATKARQVQSRIKQLDKVERIEIPAARKKIRFKFPDAPKPGRVVLELKGVRKAYGEKAVLDGIDLLIERGDRIALVGPNGAGKSTLMRILASVDQPDSGSRLEGHRVVIDYFAQDQAAALNAGYTIYEEMTAKSPNTMVPMIRTILGGFLFSGDDITKKVAVLSGGERNRLALAKMLLNPSNVLLLDEPTNHLDLDSKEVLLDALADYGGTLIFVSHDRYFVDRLATKVIEVGGGQAPLYPGGYEDFVYWKKQREAGLAAPLPKPTVRHSIDDENPRGRAQAAQPASKADVQPGPASAPSAPVPAPPRPPEPKIVAAAGGGNGQTAPKPAADPMAPRLRTASTPPDRQERQLRERELKKLKNRLSELEKRIAEKEQAVKALEAQMASPGFYDDRAQAEKAATDHKSLMWEVGDLLSQWEMVQTEVEQGEVGLSTGSVANRPR